MYIVYEVGEGWVAGVVGGEGDEVVWEVSVAGEEGETKNSGRELVDRRGGGGTTNV